jgi:hypothetical protein
MNNLFDPICFNRCEAGENYSSSLINQPFLRRNRFGVLIHTTLSPLQCRQWSSCLAFLGSFSRTVILGSLVWMLLPACFCFAPWLWAGYTTTALPETVRQSHAPFKSVRGIKRKHVKHPSAWCIVGTQCIFPSFPSVGLKKTESTFVM